jgi:signal transduction histidine kinase/ActR/RegA family two-component response regulator
MTREGASLALDPVQLINSLWALLPVPIAIVDDNGEIILANSSFSDTFAGVRSLQSLLQHELEIQGRGIYEIETVPLNDQGMKIAYAVDIGNEVQLRRQIVHMEKMAAIGRLVSGVAHELNNPLAGILGYAQLAIRSNLDTATQRMVEVILTQAERAGKIVQNFLSLAAKTEPTRVAIDLGEIVRNVARLREYQDTLDSISVKLELSEDLPQAAGDPGQIEQVLLNLVVNAEDAIADAERVPGLIQIRTALEGGRIQLSVTDNGGGIHARDMARIFDPFFTTKDKNRGTGLGLSICAEIVKDHGGELYAWSTYGSGSTFTIELPVGHGMAQEEVKPANAGEGKLLRDKSILVIDDEAHITELMFDVLARHGARVELASSGMEGLEHLKQKTYDVIVCDQRMPGLSGQRLYRLVESLNPELQHRFLFVTGDVVNPQTKQFFMQVGVQFLRKPFRIQDLVDAIEKVLIRNQPQGS